MMKTTKTKLKTWKWASLMPVVILMVIAFSCNDEITADVDEVMKTASQATVPVELQDELQKLEQQYPDAEFAYIETDIHNMDEVIRIQEIDRNSIAFVQKWIERQRIGMLVNKNGPVKNMVMKDENDIFSIVEEPAKPKNGYDELYTEIANNLVYPEQAKKAGIEGTVYVQFIVGVDGTISDVTVIRGIGAGADEAAKMVVESFEPFEPGRQQGKEVKQRIVLPIKFSLDKTMNVD